MATRGGTAHGCVAEPFFHTSSRRRLEFYSLCIQDEVVFSKYTSEVTECQGKIKFKKFWLELWIRDRLIHSQLIFKTGFSVANRSQVSLCLSC